MKFASLGSGSKGNATLIQGGNTCLLLDCGFSVRELEKRCAHLQFDIARIDAVLVSHEHADHVKGLGALARRCGMTVWMTHGTWRNSRCGDIPDLQLFGSHTSKFTIGDIKVTPYAVPHDAREPVQYAFSFDDQKLAILTDAGCITPHLLGALNNLDALLVECNHDPEMLRNGPYPPRLQARVAGDYGHLSNQQTGKFLSEIDYSRLQHLVIGHVSEKNNTPELALAAVLSQTSNLENKIRLLKQDTCSGWFELQKTPSQVTIA